MTWASRGQASSVCLSQTKLRRARLWQGMPIPPTEDPPLEAFGPIVPLEDLPYDDVKDGDRPLWRHAVPPLNDFATQASPLLFGGGVFGHGMYNQDSVLYSNEAVRALRLAFKYGINALDSSPYYFPSEFVLGRALRILAPERPRSSYFLITKCGRYGPEKHMFDYSPERVHTSIRKSLERLGTTYLDVALLHDVEFVSDQPIEAVKGSNAGWLEACAVGTAQERVWSPEEAQKVLGIASEDASQIRGPGDERVLNAARALFELKDQGLVRQVGISGYPLGELVRIVRLVASHPPYRCLDVVLSYSHHTLHSDLLPAWKDLFAACPSGREATWRAPFVLNASPFSMGLFSDRDPPAWHPADTRLMSAARGALRELQKDAASPCSVVDPSVVMGQTALFRGISGSEAVDSNGVPILRTLIGMSNVDEVHAAMRIYRVLSQPAVFEREYNQLAKYNDLVRARILEARVADKAWPSPSET